MINVVIPVHNRINYTIDCINSLKQQDCVERIKIYVVDDGSTDNTTEIITKKFPDVKIFNGDGTLFWGGAVNYGIDQVIKISKKKDWILLVNNDVEFETDAIAQLIKNSKKINRKGIMGALTLDFKDKKTIIKSGTIVKSWLLNITSHKFLGADFKTVQKQKPVKVDFLTGRCLLHPVEIFNKVKNYNSKKFPHYGADDEFSVRIKKYGYDSYLCPSSIVYLKKNKKYNYKKIFYLTKLYNAFFDIRSTTNIINKFNLAIEVVPYYAKVTFFFIGVIKSFYIFLKK